MQNIVILAGNIGQKPEVRSIQSGTKITNFTLATSRPRLSEGRVMRDENGYRVMDTEWHRITCFNGLGKTVAEHCEKGMKVIVHGRIHYTKWTDATGTDRYGCEIIAEKVDFLILGIHLKTTPVRLMGGGTRAKPCIWFSGFWSQGDGACFEGFWSHAKGAAAHIRDYAPTDATLHGIADRLQAIQRRNFYQLAAEVSHRGRYYHEYTMSIDATRDSPRWQPPTEGSEDIVTEALRDLAGWLYRQLETEYDHLTSDEAIEEGMIVNEYTFTEAGRRFG